MDVLTELRSTAQESVDQVVALTYTELRAIAHRRLAAHGAGGTLSTTALVHEAYLKLVDQSRAGWQDLAHFRALASLAMRHVLVDRARGRRALHSTARQ
jgi:DNA-directed RNA polymerase specialized sigma24 family protein